MLNFESLAFWKRSHLFATSVYRLTCCFPANETFGLTNQMRRAAVSIPSNIAEGCGRFSKAEFKRFLDIALGSLSELKYQLLLAKDLEYLSSENYFELNKELSAIQKMIYSYSQKLVAAPKHKP